VFCGNQFTPEEVYDNYPGDKIITDIGLALVAVNGQVTEMLKAFPTDINKKKQATTTTRWNRLCSRFTGILSKKAERRTK